MAEVSVCIKWSGKEFTVNCGSDETVEDLKRKLAEQTQVQPKRQKLLGLKTKANKPAEDGDKLADLQPIKPGVKIMMMGWVFH